MKKQTYFRLLGAALVAAATGVHADSIKSYDATSKTFFSVRPPYQAESPERVTAFRDRLRAREDGHAGTVQLVIFGGQSDDKDSLARYFFPTYKTSLVAGELFSQAMLNREADLNANQFGVWTDTTSITNFKNVTKSQLANVYANQNLKFQSTICMAPQQSVIGAGLTYRQGFCEEWWFEVSLPILRVSNNLNFSETIAETTVPAKAPEGFVANITDALTGQTVFLDKVFQYGKVDLCSRKKTGVADVEINIGHIVADQDCCYLEGYAGVVIPTGNKPKAEYIFEPIVGNNHHFGIQMGSRSYFELWHCGDCSLNMEFNGNLRYLFRNTQTRSYDLVDKQWSRYTWVYADEGNNGATLQPFASINPGINFFTNDVRVSPRYNFTSNFAAVFRHGCHWEGELGYSAYARAEERIEFGKCCPKLPAIVGIEEDDSINPGNNAALPAFTKSNGRINTGLVAQSRILNDVNAQNNNLPKFTPVTIEQLDLKSAAHPCMISSTIYGSGSYRWDYCDFPFFIALAGSYEFADENSGLDRWLVWGKFGMSF